MLTRLHPPLPSAGLNPYGVVHLSSQLVLEQAYDVSVELTLPRSPPNTERGNFMVALFAIKSRPEDPGSSPTAAWAQQPPPDPYAHVTPENVVFSSRRPALIPYRDPLVARAARLVFLPYHILFSPRAETAALSVPMGELVEFRRDLPLALLLDVQAGQTLQVYAATVTLVARLRGLRWLMYNHRVLSFVAGTALFWFAEMLSMAVAWLLVAHYFTGDGRQDDGGDAATAGDRGPPRLRGELYREQPGRSDLGVKQEEDVYDEEEQEEKDVEIKDEWEEGAGPETPTELSRQVHSGDADDEEEGDDAWRESRPGASGFHDGKGGSVRRRSSKGGRA